MHKGNPSAKKVSSNSIQPINQQYRSQASKVSSTANKTKEIYAFQNMKEFKCEIDHQIAKCLDTLDRQGLKFLKETLRASKIFGLNTQQLGKTLPVQENIEIDEQSPPKPKQIPKKIQPISHASQLKKGTKVQASKKSQPTTKSTKQFEVKSQLNQKINKRLQNLNIKTGKKSTKQNINKKVQVPEKHKVEPNPLQIAEQIQIQQPQIVQNEHEQKQQQSIKNEPFPNLYEKNQNGHPIFYQSSKQWLKNKSSAQLELKNQENMLLKPFCKKQFKKHHDQSKHKENKDFGIQVSKQDEIRKIINEQSIQKIDKDSIIKKYQQNIQIYEERQQKQPPNDQIKFSEISIKSSKQQISQEQIKQEENKKQPQQQDLNMQKLINVITRLSPTKRNKLQRIIQKLQNSDKFQSTSSLIQNINNQESQISYHKPYIAQKMSFSKNNEVKNNHSKSKSKIQKVEKASSLKSSLMKKIKTVTPENHTHMTPSINKKQQKQSLQQSKKNIQKQGSILELYEDAKSQMISQQKRVQGKTNSFVDEKSQIRNTSSNINLSHSNHFNSSETGQKLIKIGKKKNQITNILFKILSNNGHNSLVGLNSIQIFNIQGQILSVEDLNIKNTNPKLIKLFTENYNGQGWFTTLQNSSFSIENLTQQIGGIRIINWNKSQLEADRQVDLMQIWINDQLHWRGQVKGGSYKQNEIYATNIKVAQRHFQFPQIIPKLQKSILKQQKSPKNISNPISNMQVFLENHSKKQKQAHWLQKQVLQKKIKEIEEEQKKDEKIKKITNMRNTLSNSNAFEKINKLDDSLILKKQSKPVEFKKDWLHQQSPKQKRLQYKYQNEPKINLKSNNDDILFELSKPQAKKKKQDLTVSLTKKKDELKPKLNKEQSISKKQQEYLIKKQQQQDDQFQKILQSMQQRQKVRQISKVLTPKKPQKQFQPQIAENKGKVIAQKNFEDFMKDSLFDDKPVVKRFENKQFKLTPKANQEPIATFSIKTPKKSNDLDNLIDQLNDVIGGQNLQQTGQQFYIPQLPKGKQISITLLSNWGNQSFIGLNGIQLFDSDGESIRPIGVACSLINSKQLYQKMFKHQLLTSDQKIQIKFPKNKKVLISLVFSQRIELAAIRFWNYSGHRVHNNIGVKKIHIKFDGNFIFSGQIQQSSGSSEDVFKSCQYILFTENNHILKKINDNDWLNRYNSKEQEQRKLFKTTLQNFHRPITRNDQQINKKNGVQIEVERQPIKIPKRLCFEYDPPILPEGFTLKFVLHSSWGDRFFIGLNGIEIFNQKGQNIINKNLIQIRADPSSISKLQGYERDKRVVSNLINGKNNTSIDSNIWLAPLLSDVEKIEKGRPNIIQIQYNKSFKLSGINFFNYIKTPERGVKQIQIFLDNYLLYRGYLRKYSKQIGIICTSISFTKQQSLLEAMNFVGYNEDHREQDVALVNEQRIIKANNNSYDINLTRPMTGKNLI